MSVNIALVTEKAFAPSQSTGKNKIDNCATR
jgi:hypothetical protein